MTKTYDRAYFDRFYRNRDTRVHERGELERKVAMALSVTEYVLHRRARTALDIGCGEAPWRKHLLAARPQLRYQGYDASDYAVERFGRTRSIRKATLADLPELELEGADLIICSDVLHYASEADVRRVASTIADFCIGSAYVEVLTSEDDVVGDLHGFLFRPAAWYRTVFGKAGLTQVAPYMWVPEGTRVTLSQLEISRR